MASSAFTLPDFSHLAPLDRRALSALSMMATLLLIGLTATGTWLLIDGTPTEADPSKVAVVHDALGDIAAAVVLLLACWISYRVLFRISLSGAAALAIVMFAILSGSQVASETVIAAWTIAHALTVPALVALYTVAISRNHAATATPVG